ncbi:hypothetical protein ACIU4M_00795 [Bacillus altitudinis]|uniref:hypothetical protein n=1 Tax=Bacillus altitudinis TaxID=293387 RepID=UPI0038998C27
MAIKVVVPNKSYNEVFLGVQFTNGEGIFEDEKLAKEIADTLGYEIVKDQAEPETVEEEKPKRKAPVKKKTVKKADE